MNLDHTAKSAGWDCEAVPGNHMTTQQLNSSYYEKYRRLSDLHKATLFLYLIKRGLPPWADGYNQPLALMSMTGWTKKRATAALEKCVHAGYADYPKNQKDSMRGRASARTIDNKP
jgi:hypothetical protein